MPFRHPCSGVRTARPGRVSITFRLSALSAQALRATVAQAGNSRLNYLSAQCPFGTRRTSREDQDIGRVSITFRLSALSALIPFARILEINGIESQLPFGSVPFRHLATQRPTSTPRPLCLNYLSAQCPFGTSIPFGLVIQPLLSLNYLSAQCPFGTSFVK